MLSPACAFVRHSLRIRMLGLHTYVMLGLRIGRHELIHVAHDYLQGSTLDLRDSIHLKPFSLLSFLHVCLARLQDSVNVIVHVE
jgi:hypothetical protein